MNLNPFSRRRRSLQPRGDAVLRRLDENGKPASDPDAPSTRSNWPILGWIAVSRKGANLIAHGSQMPSSEASEIPRSPEDPSANRIGPNNRVVIAGQRIPDPPMVPKPPEERCGICHHPVGHTQDCSHWAFLNPEAFPND